MTVWDGKLLKENELSKPAKVIVGVAIVIAIAFATTTAARNVTGGVVVRPWALGIVLIGFICFLVPKLTVIREKRRLSFGTRLMTNPQANLYRLGYFLMGIGLLLAFS